MVISATERIYYSSSGKPYRVLVRFKDDAYKDCTEEELRQRREEFERTAVRIAGAALKRNRGETHDPE